MMLRAPPFLLGVTFLFWGWQTGFFAVGVILGVALELANWTRVRWEFTDDDFTRIWTLCSLMLLAAAIYAFTANDAPSDLLSMLQNPSLRAQRNAGNSSARAMAELIRWQPMIFFPFMAAASYSVREGVPLHTISLILRRRWQRARKAHAPMPASPTVNISYFYFGLCLFASSVQESEGTVFFWGFTVLVAWALWPLRSRRFSPITWAALLALVMGFGFAGQFGISQLQQYLVSLNPSWLSKYSRFRFDARQARTAIGNVGRLKTSGEIIIRLEPKEGSRVPHLLREASYRNYRAEVWYTATGRNDFETVNSETNGTTFNLIPGKTPITPVSIACYLSGGQGLLPLPRGTAKLENLNAFVLQKNSFGAVHADGPGLVIFDAYHGPGDTIDAPPEDEADPRTVPAREKAALQKVISELKLQGLPIQEVLTSLQQYFTTNFSYSYYQEETRPLSRKAQSPLSRFLLETRKGHCEFFATATVLLLRELGLPARYAVGYAVHEPSGKEGYIVRQRDAHAWALVYYNNVWHDFDTTPGSWIEAEGMRASPFQKISDLWSRITFEISKIRWGQSNLRQILLWSLVPVFGMLIVQIVRSRRKRHGKTEKSVLSSRTWPGLDSEFYLLERKLAQRGLPRAEGETLSGWLTRALAALGRAEQVPALRALLGLHYRYRFHPEGLRIEERETLREKTGDVLKGLSV